MDLRQITRPTLIIQEAIVRRNITKMMAKLSPQNSFRPHFKTHQNLEIGKIFYEMGVRKIAVSSLEMAEFFANDCWEDITIAIPTNLRQINEINKLAAKINLELTIDSIDSAEFLLKNITQKIGLWLEIDSGQKRSGFWFEEISAIRNCAEKIRNSGNKLIELKGILNHAGHSYSCNSKSEITALYQENLQKLNHVKTAISNKDWQPQISFGDTPCCSVIDSFAGIDEIRCGNFVYYDITQTKIGSCSQQDVAVAVALPIISIHPERSEVIVYGGGVHMSKDVIIENSQSFYGSPVLLEKDWWKILPSENKMTKLSQEHGTLSLQRDILKNLKIGDLIFVQPVHSCMTADILRNNTIII
jgi:D-serine deaminase-like pyridoxal phosphate-dependent protein